MDLLSFLAQMQADGTFRLLGTNAGAQFGVEGRQYLGATVLPERLVTENMFKEAGIRYMTVLANDGSRYSPAQKKDGGELVGTFEVVLGDQDIARELTGRDYDALLSLVGGGRTMEAMATVMRWADVTLNRALLELNEKQRWEAIVNSQVVRKGDNGFQETVVYPNPTGHRVAAAGTWSSDAYDPMDDLVAMADKLTDKGYTPNRIITSTRVLRILERNDKIARRLGPVRVLSATDIVGRVTRGDLTGGLGAMGLPAPEAYDLTYRDQVASARFLANDVVVMLSTTGRDETIEVADGVRYLADTLGYHAIGRPVGQPGPGRVIRLEPQENKPPRIEGEAWQTSLPVITEPEAIGVITGIA